HAEPQRLGLGARLDELALLLLGVLGGPRRLEPDRAPRTRRRGLGLARDLEPDRPAARADAGVLDRELVVGGDPRREVGPGARELLLEVARPARRLAAVLLDRLELARLLGELRLELVLDLDELGRPGRDRARLLAGLAGADALLLEGAPGAFYELRLLGALLLLLGELRLE